jgi:hypothetical protein
MANIVENYYNTDNKKYRFVPDTINDSSYVIAIHAWSQVERKYLFQDNLTCQKYVELLEEPAMKFADMFSSFDPSFKQNERNFSKILQENDIPFDYGTRGGRYGNREMDSQLLFRDKEGVEKCVDLLQQTFMAVII